MLLILSLLLLLLLLLIIFLSFLAFRGISSRSGLIGITSHHLSLKRIEIRIIQELIWNWVREVTRRVNLQQITTW